MGKKAYLVAISGVFFLSSLVFANPFREHSQKKAINEAMFVDVEEIAKQVSLEAQRAEYLKAEHLGMIEAIKSSKRLPREAARLGLIDTRSNRSRNQKLRNLRRMRNAIKLNLVLDEEETRDIDALLLKELAVLTRDG